MSENKPPSRRHGSKWIALVALASALGVVGIAALLTSSAWHQQEARNRSTAWSP
jgi:flagellar basal body-associated protein FliL